MNRKMQMSGITGIIPLICISLSGASQCSVLLNPEFSQGASLVG